MYALPRILLLDYNATDIDINGEYLDESYCLKKLDGDTSSQIYRMVYK